MKPTLNNLEMAGARLLIGLDVRRAKTIIAENHYAKGVPSGKTTAISYEDALLLFSIPANKNIASFLGFSEVWELSRLWAPDGHRRNLLTEALSAACALFRVHHPTVDALVSYADPNAGHQGTIYKAASWHFCGRSEESRLYEDNDGQVMARRAFHSGSAFMRKADIIAAGYSELKGEGKLRFVKPLTPKARRAWAKRAK